MRISILIFILYNTQYNFQNWPIIQPFFHFNTGMHIKTNLLGTELFQVISKRFEMHLLEHMFLTSLVPFM